MRIEEHPPTQNIGRGKVVVEQDDKLLVKYVWQARGERRLIPSISVVLQSLNGQRPTPKLFQRKDEINPNSNCLDSFHFGIIARQNILAYLSACFRWGCIATLLQAAGWGFDLWAPDQAIMRLPHPPYKVTHLLTTPLDGSPPVERLATPHFETPLCLPNIVWNLQKHIKAQ